MNGRTVFALNHRSPVLAWNVEPQPLPQPYAADMPAAAAAAISPADPYAARCWQNQVDAGSGFSYFGALYNNSLPPTAYRLQPGCMANLGQFWPPTPPPDGCGRFDGSNLYLGPHVYRHGENISSNLRNSYQGLGHYSHVVEAPKESSQRSYKRETPISPNVSTSGISLGSSVSKSENISTLCVDSKLKPQVTISSTLPKQEIISASTSSHEPYLCAPDSRGSSNMHPSTDKACFSPSYSLKSSINFHNSSQDSLSLKGKSLNGTQENNCNASPLKNVYFSSIESENVNSMLSKKFKSSDEPFRFEPRSVPLDVNKSKNSLQSTNSFLLHNSYSSKKYEMVSQDYCTISSNCKIRTDKQADCVLVGEQQYKQRNNVCRVKPEKISHSDCKYQKSLKSSSTLPVTDYRTSSDVFNIPTSVMPPKLEPNDKYFLSNCSSTVPNCMTNSSYANTGPYLLTKDYSPGYRNIVYPSSCSLSKPWHMNELPLISPESYFKAPEAAKPPVPGPPYSNSVMPEELISVAQTAPQDMDVIRFGGKLQQGSQPPKRTLVQESSDEDEVQIISVRTRSPTVSKNIARQPTESKRSQLQTVSVVSPLCLKTEKDLEEATDKSSTNVTNENTEDKVQWIKSEPNAEPAPPVLEKETEDAKYPLDCVTEKETSNYKCTSETSENKCEMVTIKKEILQEEEPVISCDSTVHEKKVVKVEEPEQEKDLCEKPELSEEKDTCSNTSKLPELKECHDNVPTADFNDNHNLNLLLNTIEKVTSLEKSTVITIPQNVKSEPIADDGSSEPPPKNFAEQPKTCGLDLLSVIAGQRLVTEFDDVSEKEDIKSNYPLVKQENLNTSEQTKPSCDIPSSLQKATVFEMQDRLVELQKKYKQKQKELSRLKPKKRFASIYLNGRKKSKDYNDVSSGSNMDSSDLNSSVCSASDDTPVVDDQSKAVTNESSIKEENKSENKGVKRKFPSRKSSTERSSHPPSEKRITTRSSSRHSVKPSKSEDISVNSVNSRKITRNSKNKGYQLRKTKESNVSNSADDDIQIISVCEESVKSKEPSKKSSSESDKNMKAYSLRHSSSQANNKKQETSSPSDSALCSKTITSKRKSDNPQKYMPSKQSKLSETIIAKHLRSRILFDTSGSMSDDDTKDGGVPEELYDALMKCHLEDQSKKETLSKSLSSNCPLASPEPSRLKPENLVVKQRLLALEEGLFYAGYIKEVQASDRYGIALDGQRGNRLHIFTQEELLTQTIVESKPLSSELPEGTRVCAYWSQQYRCLYPGIVGKAPCPSADWSEPRVFVLFDDGDSGQIPTKNIRLIPTDIIPAENDQENDSPPDLPKSSSTHLSTSAQERAPRRLRCSTAKPSVKECDTSNENESKDSSCASINDSSCDDSCFIEYSSSPSQNSKNFLRIENSSCSVSNDADATKSEKRQKKCSKRKTRIKFKSEEAKEKCEAKTKRHKKYKEKHRRHHHHHHHHRHHHHHHHHSKKHKHRKKNIKTFATLDLENGNFIPCSVSHKSFKSFQMDAEACTNLVEHSSTINLPQNENDRVC